MTGAADDKADVAVIGSGIGGLTVAIALLKLGFRVVVVEKNALPGGLMRGYLRKGIACPVGVHYVGSLGEGQPLRRMFDYLGVTSTIPLERMGEDGVIDRYLFNDFTFDLPEGVDAFEDRLRQAFPQDRIPIDAVMHNLRDLAGQMDRLEGLFSPDSHFFLQGPLSGSLGDLLRELNASPGLRSVLGMTGSWIGVPLDECPAYFHHMALLSYLLSSWRCSGLAMADAFVGRVKELGGVILAGDPAEKILVHEKASAGIVLQSGRVIRSSGVVAAIHPKNVLPMLPPGAVRPAYIERIRDLEDTHGVFCAHFSVDAGKHEDFPFNLFKVETNVAGGIEDVIFYQIRKSEHPGINTLSILTSIDPEAWRSWENTQTGRRGRAYGEAKAEKANGLLRKAAALFGPLEDAALIDACTHLSFRDWVGSPGGSAYGVLRSTRQMTRTALLNRTSIQGLYLAGQSVLAPGIFGTTLGSFQTVRSMIGPERFRDEVRL